MKKQAVLDLENELATSKWDFFQEGDTVSVHYRIQEGGKERIQVIKGVVICVRGEATGKNFTVRKLSSGFGVERTFPYHSPYIEDVKVDKHGKVRRSKLYYLRDRTGRATRIAEKINYQQNNEEDQNSED